MGKKLHCLNDSFNRSQHIFLQFSQASRGINQNQQQEWKAHLESMLAKKWQCKRGNRKATDWEINSKKISDIKNCEKNYVLLYESYHIIFLFFLIKFFYYIFLLFF